MGCVCSKGFFPHEYVVANHIRDKAFKGNKHKKRLGASLRREEAVVEGDGGGNDATARLITNPPAEIVGSTTILWDEGEKKVLNEKPGKPQLQKRSTMDVGQVEPRVSSIGSLLNGERGAQVVAGWPSWLSAVAGEAINGWVPRKAESFQKLDKVSWLFLHPCIFDSSFIVLILTSSPMQMVLDFMKTHLTFSRQMSHVY